MNVRIYGDTAVVTGINVLKETLRGRDIGGTFRFTDTFVRRGGAWQCVAGHSSKMLKK
jgi:hypothetical protein